MISNSGVHSKCTSKATIAHKKQLKTAKKDTTFNRRLLSKTESTVIYKALSPKPHKTTQYNNLTPPLHYFLLWEFLWGCHAMMLPKVPLRSHAQTAIHSLAANFILSNYRLQLLVPKYHWLGLTSPGASRKSQKWTVIVHLGESPWVLQAPKWYSRWKTEEKLPKPVLTNTDCIFWVIYPQNIILK